MKIKVSIALEKIEKIAGLYKKIELLYDFLNNSDNTEIKTEISKQTGISPHDIKEIKEILLCEQYKIKDKIDNLEIDH
jgi:hypothetical protein